MAQKTSVRAAAITRRVEVVQAALPRVQAKCDRSLESFDFDERA